MHSRLTVPLFAALLALFAVAGSANEPAIPVANTVTLSQVQYLHRWSKGEQHEFTPQGQENLERWSDMVTLNYYRSVKDGEGLAATANSTLETYKAHRAIVIKTDSVPRTPTTPAEFLIVVIFGQPTYIEAAFARFKLVNGVALSVVYSHRIYGSNIGPQMSAWLQQHGPATEKALMTLDNIPVMDVAKN